MISTIAAGSMKLPAPSRIRLTSSRNTISPKPCADIHAAIVCGICSEAIRKLNSTALVMMYSSIELIAAAFSSTLGTSFRPMSL